MDVLYQRGSYIFIVKKNGKFYMVNTEIRKCSIAVPPDKPDMFLKFGYFKAVNETSVSVRNDIMSVMKEHNM
jgi:hypothetical protein